MVVGGGGGKSGSRHVADPSRGGARDIKRYHDNQAWDSTYIFLGLLDSCRYLVVGSRRFMFSEVDFILPVHDNLRLGAELLDADLPLRHDAGGAWGPGGGVRKVPKVGGKPAKKNRSNHSGRG